MKKIRAFKCANNHTFEHMVTDDQLIAQCECGELANRVISAARYFSNTTGKSPSAR